MNSRQLRLPQNYPRILNTSQKVNCPPYYLHYCCPFCIYHIPDFKLIEAHLVSDHQCGLQQAPVTSESYSEESPSMLVLVMIWLCGGILFVACIWLYIWIQLQDVGNKVNND